MSEQGSVQSAPVAQAGQPAKCGDPVRIRAAFVNQGGKAGIDRVYDRAVSDRLKATDHTRVQVLLYPGARHEILRETNSPEVYRDIDAFITKSVLQAK